MKNFKFILILMVIFVSFGFSNSYASSVEEKIKMDDKEVFDVSELKSDVSEPSNLIDELVKEELDYVDIKTVKQIDVEKLAKEGAEIIKNMNTKAHQYYYPTKYYQNGQSWSSNVMHTCGKTIGTHGCALTSFSMLVSLYNFNDDPGKVNWVMGNSACPFKWYVGENKYGLPSCHYSNSTLSNSTAKNSLVSILKNKGVCIVGMKKGSGKHFVLARGYYKANGNINIYIYDPSKQRNYSKLRHYLNKGYKVNRLIYYYN